MTDNGRMFYYEDAGEDVSCFGPSDESGRVYDYDDEIRQLTETDEMNGRFLGEDEI